MSANHGRTISAIGVIENKGIDEFFLNIYHNYFAGIILKPKIFNGFSSVNQFKIKGDPTLGFTEWEAIK